MPTNHTPFFQLSFLEFVHGPLKVEMATVVRTVVRTVCS